MAAMPYVVINNIIYEKKKPINGVLRVLIDQFYNYKYDSILNYLIAIFITDDCFLLCLKSRPPGAK